MFTLFIIEVGTTVRKLATNLIIINTNMVEVEAQVGGSTRGVVEYVWFVKITGAMQ